MFNFYTNEYETDTNIVVFLNDLKFEKTSMQFNKTEIIHDVETGKK